ncbi:MULTISPECIES: restriction endonuclease subunit S [unclassified Mannheimia]|uniref:restriction endonuclease subunit S n=1 Tax=unclassified Mannheimia TaxID=2645054 RepID=UPI00359D5202
MKSFSGSTPSTSVKEYYGGDIKWITSSDLNKGFIFDVNATITELGLQNSSAKKVKKDTLLLALYGATAGVVGITRIDATINQAILAIIPKKDSYLFLYYWFLLNKQKIIDTYTQGGQANLSGDSR